MGLEPLPGDVRRAVVRDEDLAVLGTSDLPARRGPARHLTPRVHGAVPVAIGPGIDRVMEQVLQRLAIGAPPLELTFVRAAVGPDRHPDPMMHEGAEQAVQAPLTLEFLKDQVDHGLGLLVGIKGEPAGGQLDVPDRRMREQLTAAGLVELALIHPFLEDMKLCLGHGPLQPEQQPVVVIRRVIEPIGIGQERMIPRTQLQQVVPVGAGARQPAHLQAKDQPDLVQGDLRQQPLESRPPLGGLTAASLVLVDDGDLRPAPAQLEGALGEGVLAGGGFAMVEHLLRARLPDVDDGAALEMPGLDLRRPALNAMNMSGIIHC